MKIKTLILISMLALTGAAADLPSLVMPQGMGVNIHFARGHERDLDLIASAGFKFIRMDLGWAGIERKKGEYDWSAYDELTADLQKRGLRAIYILDYSNPLYEEMVVSKNPLTGQEHRDVASPQHTESIDAFAQWTAAAAKHFRDARVVWEIWNEPNISFWKPKPNVEQYTALALATCREIRKSVPDATIVGPATSGFPWEFLESFLKSGVLDHLDAISVHPYRNYSNAPETAARDYDRLRELIGRLAPNAEKKTLPILSGEWGYASHTKGVSLEIQAAFLARQQLANLLAGVPISIWYDWKNDGEDPTEREHNFGIVATDLKRKPAYVAAQILTRELSGFRMARRLEIGIEKDFVLLLRNETGAHKLAAWTVGEPHTISVDAGPTSEGEVAIVTGLGAKSLAKLESSRLSLELEAMPAYVTLGSTKISK